MKLSQLFENDKVASGRNLMMLRNAIRQGRSLYVIDEIGKQQQLYFKTEDSKWHYSGNEDVFDTTELAELLVRQDGKLHFGY